MTIATALTLNLLDALDLPIIDGRVDWDALTAEQLHDVIRGAGQRIGELEPAGPTGGVLQRSLLLDESIRALSPLQHRYAGLLKDAFDTPKLRVTLHLPEGKTPFRDANDLLAKTHGLRANEATGRMKIAAAMTPVRASDPDRDDDVAVGETKLPLLGALQANGQVHPTKLSSALNMLNEIDKNAEAAGKDQDYRDKLRTVVEKDLVEKIEHTTPEEFGRYVGRRKNDLLTAIDPPDKKFTQQQTDGMYDARCLGPVRGNPDAHEWRLVTSAEFSETAQTLMSVINNPRGKDDEGSEFDTRSQGHKRMQAVCDALKFSLANLDNAEFRGASGAHTQMMVMIDYPTLMEGLRKELADLLPEIAAEKREMLLHVLAEAELARTKEQEGTTLGEDPDSSDVITLPTGATQEFFKNGVRESPENSSPDDSEVRSPTPERITLGDTVLTVPTKTTDIDEILDDDNLDRLQPRISQGIYTSNMPPDMALRLLCNVGVTPVTFTGQREVLSVGRQQRQFSSAIRKAILARDRGCAVPGCHWPASWCELHHIKYWSQDGETSTENGVMICSHHHHALHAKMLIITRVNGEIQFKLHPLIDPAQEPRKNYFWQA